VPTTSLPSRTRYSSPASAFFATGWRGNGVGQFGCPIAAVHAAASSSRASATSTSVGVAGRTMSESTAAYFVMIAVDGFDGLLEPRLLRAVTVNV
jgi:hypothetical protein